MHARKHAVGRALLGAAVASVIGTATMAPAQAATDETGQEVEAAVAEATAFWTEYDVAPAVQDELAAKLVDGIPLDAGNPHLAPEEVDLEIADGIEFEVSTFGDGSIAVTWRQVESGYVDTAALEDPSIRPVVEEAPAPSDTGSLATINATSITNCSVAAGSGYSNYSNCVVGGGVTGFRMWFYANYSIVTGARNDSISQTVNPGRSYNTPYTDASLPERSNFVKKETSAGPAGATYTATYDTEIGGVKGGSTAYLSLAVGANKASVTFTQL